MGHYNKFVELLQQIRSPSLIKGLSPRTVQKLEQNRLEVGLKVEF
jgi:hypothetical protein